MSKKPKNLRRSSATLRASSKAQRARKRKVLKRDAARQERIRIAFEGFKVSAAAQAMAGLDAATFFERLDSYPASLALTQWNAGGVVTCSSASTN